MQPIYNLSRRSWGTRQKQKKHSDSKKDGVKSYSDKLSPFPFQTKPMEFSLKKTFKLHTVNSRQCSNSPCILNLQTGSKLTNIQLFQKKKSLSFIKNASKIFQQQIKDFSLRQKNNHPDSRFPTLFVPSKMGTQAITSCEARPALPSGKCPRWGWWWGVVLHPVFRSTTCQ